MNLEECAWATNQHGLPLHDRFVLLVLATLSTDFKASFILADLAKQTLLTIDECKQSLKRLEKHGLIQWRQTGWDKGLGCFTSVAILNKDCQV